jgi:hypothetical protein
LKVHAKQYTRKAKNERKHDIELRASAPTIYLRTRVFERITLNRQGLKGDLIDLGTLAECLVFYDRVRVIADAEVFQYLVRCCGESELLDLMSMGALEIVYFENLTCVGAIPTNQGTLYELATVATESIRYQRMSRKFFDEQSGPSGKGGDKLLRRFDKLVQRSSYSTALLEEMHRDLLDRGYVRTAAQSLLEALSPEYLAPRDFQFDLNPVLKGGTYKVDTNIDFDGVNASYFNHAPKGSDPLTLAGLLYYIVETRRTISVGSRLESDFALSPAHALVASNKFSGIMRSANSGLGIAEMFQEEVIDGVPNIKHVINAGQRNFTDIVKLVDGAKPFKEWRRKQEDAGDLRKAYLRDVSHVDWADNIPPKAVRWLLMTGAGLILGAVATPLVGGVGTAALAAADYFVLDKFLKGWKPNQFIEKPLKQFLTSQRERKG